VARKAFGGCSLQGAGVQGGSTTVVEVVDDVAVTDDVVVVWDCAVAGNNTAAAVSTAAT